MEQEMGVKDMRAFYAIVEEGNISHAALRLNIAQPALSRQMKRLEEKLNVKLFERGSRRIRLTDAGRLLCTRVESILGMVDGTVREISEIGSGAKGSVKIGTITTSGAMILPDLIAKYHKKYPEVTFEIWEGDGARVLELLDNHLIEIAITRTQVDNLAYELLVLPNEPLVMVMNKKNSCGKKADVIRLSEIKGQQMIIPLRWKSIFETNCKNLGFEPKIICVSDSIMQGLLMAKKNLGIAMTPLLNQSPVDDSDLIFKRIIDPEMTTHTVISWLKNQTLSKSAKNFIDMFKTMFMAEEV